jgi:anti-sigma B factor antagonist
VGATDFHASITLQADQAHLVVTGDMDVATARQVRGRLDDALAQGCTGFTVDVAGVTFVDAAGLGTFVHLHNATVELAGTVTFVATSPSFRRVCRLAGLTEAFGLGAGAKNLPAGASREPLVSHENQVSRHRDELVMVAASE